jgi:hypothetical protein
MDPNGWLGVPYIISGGIVMILGFFLKRINMKLDQTMDEPSIRALIHDKLEPILVTQEELKDDMKHIRDRLDEIVSLLLKRGVDTDK